MDFLYCTTLLFLAGQSARVNAYQLGESSRIEHDQEIVLQAFPSDLYHSSVEPFNSFPCQPKRLHLAQSTNVAGPQRDTEAQTNNNDNDNGSSSLVTMTISFSLDFVECSQVKPIVLYGRSDNTTRLHPVKHSTVDAGDPVQFNYTSLKTMGVYHSDWIYHVKIPDLRAGLLQHWYRIIVLQESSSHPLASAPPPLMQRRSLRGSGGYYLGETKTYNFLTPPLRGHPTTLALVGDLGQTSNSARTILDIYEATQVVHDSGEPPVSQLLIAGDMSYADSNPTRWTSWLELIEPLVRSTPMHVAAGNHEIECDIWSREIFVPYEHWFYNPNRQAPAVTQPVTQEYIDSLWNHSCSAPSAFQGHYDWGNSFYSYQHGLVHVIVLNSYSDCRKGSVQYMWLKRELEVHFDRQETPWLLVAFHSPLYTTFLGHVNEVQSVRMKDAMEPLFAKYGVNLVVAGHDHAYMRTLPLYNDKVDPTGKAPIYMILGAGGNHEGHSRAFRNSEPEEWVAKRTLQDFGYGNLFVANATHARFQWMRDQTSSNEFQDILWLENPHTI